MRRSNPILTLTPLVLAAALAAGCDSPTDGDPALLRAPEAQAASAAPAASSAPVSTVTPLPDGGFRFVGTAVLDVPEGAAWAKIHNIEKVVEIALPGLTSDFRWLDGGSPGTWPSRYQFTALGTTVFEEVFFVDRAEKVLKYHQLSPALGIQSYVATVSLDPVDKHHTLLTYSRDVSFDDPASVDAFAALFAQQIVYFQAYFADKAR